MNLLITVLLADLIIFTYSHASDPSHFFLKGPTAQATIYGVDGSKIISVADAGSISSDGNVGPSVSSYSSNQNVEAPGTNKLFSSDCNCSQDEPSVVLQGPSMSATIIGPSDNNAAAQDNQNNVLNNLKHNGLNSASSTSGQSVDTSALPSVSSVNIQGPSTWASNTGPSYTSHGEFVKNKDNQQFSATGTEPCESTSKNCGDKSFRTTHHRGTSINTYDSSVLPSNTGSNYNSMHDYQSTAGTSVNGLQNGKNMNNYSFPSPAFTYSSGHNVANSNTQKSSLLSKPCDQFSKDCNPSESSLNRGASVTIQGPSASSIADSSRNNRNNVASAYLQHSTTVPVLCNSYSKNCDYVTSSSTSITHTNIDSPSKSASTNRPNYNSGFTGNSNINNHASTSNGAYPFASSTPNGYVSGKRNDKQEEFGAIFKSSYVMPSSEKSDSSSGSLQNGHSSSLPSYTHGFNYNTASSGIQKSSSISTEPCNEFSKDCDLSNVNGGNNANIQSPSTSSSFTSSNNNALLGSSTGSGSLQHSAGASEYCNSSSKSCDSNVPSAFPSVKDTSYNTGSFRNVNLNHGFPINNGAYTSSPGSSNSFDYITGSNKVKIPHDTVQDSFKASSTIESSYNFGHGGEHKSPYSIFSNKKLIYNSEDSNSKQGIYNNHRYPTLSPASDALGQESTISSTLNGPSDNLDNIRSKQGSFTSFSYVSPVYNKPNQRGSSKLLPSKSINNNAALPENSINFNKRNNDYIISKHHIEASSLAPPTFIIPNSIPWVANGVNQNDGTLNLNQKKLFNFGTGGKNEKDAKFDCYILQFPANTYAYVLPSGEYSELLKKITQSALMDSNINHKRSY